MLATAGGEGARLGATSALSPSSPPHLHFLHPPQTVWRSHNTNTREWSALFANLRMEHHFPSLAQEAARYFILRC